MDRAATPLTQQKSDGYNNNGSAISFTDHKGRVTTRPTTR